MWLIFVQAQLIIKLRKSAWTRADPFRTINYRHLDISGHDGMDEQDIGWRNGWC
jgi:hypothetical protein